MKQRLSALLLVLVLVWAALPRAGAAEAGDEVIVEALKGFFAGAEGDYAAVNRNDGGALSLGLLQWHGVRGLELLRLALDQWPGTANYLTPALYAEITDPDTDWSRRVLEPGEGERIAALLGSPDGRAAQDALARRDILGYLALCRSWGMASDETAAYFAVIVNQFGAGGAAAYLRHIRAALGVGEDAVFDDLEALHRAVHATETYGQRYLSMRDKSYDYIRSLGWGTKGLTDLPAPGHWARAGIDFALARGLMRGVGGGRFDPEGTLTRAMAVTILHRLAGSPAPAGGPVFADVDPGQWYAPAVAWGRETGIVRGVTGTRFDPQAPVSRQELGALLYRWAGVMGAEPEGRGDQLDRFADGAAVLPYARAALAWGAGVGLFRGEPGPEGPLLNPGATATRAQAAVLFARFWDLLPGEGGPCPN